MFEQLNSDRTPWVSWRRRADFERNPGAGRQGLLTSDVRYVEKELFVPATLNR
jgi:hypothetical protein